MSYEETFFIIPRYIRKLEGITLAYLDVYETMFQFWNKNLNCYLSNQAIQDRTGLGHTQVNQALIFFEKRGELKREIHNGKRYLVQPQRKIETDFDCPEGTAPPVGGYRSYGSEGTAPPVHNIKNLNKEIITNTHTACAHAREDELYSHPTQKQQAIKMRKLCEEDEKVKEIYESLPEDIKTLKTLEDIHNECVSHYATQLNPQVVSPERLRSWMQRDITRMKKDKLREKAHEMASSVVDESGKIISSQKRKNNNFYIAPTTWELEI